MKKKNFEHPTAQANYEADESKRVTTDVDIDMNLDAVKRKAMLDKINEKVQWEIMKMMEGNDTCLHFMRSFYRYCFEWAEQNGLQFWEVGLDDKESFLSHDGKTIMVKPVYTANNPNPMTGEKKTQSGLIIPGGV